MDHQAQDTNNNAYTFHELIHSIFYPTVAEDVKAQPIPATANTHLCDHHEFRIRFQHALYRADRSQHSFALILLNTAEDTLLDDRTSIRIARRIRSCLRMSDSLLQCKNGHYAILLEDIHEFGTIPVAVEKIRHTLGSPIHTAPGISTSVIVNAGVSTFPEDGFQTRTLWAAAQAALQRAISRGPGSFEYANIKLARHAKENLETSAALYRAHRNREFELHYQPIVKTDSGAVQRIETLLRWNHPAQGLLPPRRFLHLLEESGFIIPVGEWVVKTAYEQALKLQQAGHNHIPFCINISARQFLEPDFAAYVEQLVCGQGFDPSLVEFECPETVLMQDLNASKEILGTLAGLGVPVTIDRFGLASYALTDLMHLPVSGLKIDYELIRRLPFDHTCKAIISGILTFAEGAGIRASANGVENIGQMQFLYERSCDEVQGHFVARPMSFAELEHWLPN